jgi:hypothetical protein
MTIAQRFIAGSKGVQDVSSPGGTTETHVAAMAWPRFSRPSGTLSVFNAHYPSDESLGYFRPAPPGQDERGRWAKGYNRAKNRSVLRSQLKSSTRISYRKPIREYSLPKISLLI